MLGTSERLEYSALKRLGMVCSGSTALRHRPQALNAFSCHHNFNFQNLSADGNYLRGRTTITTNVVRHTAYKGGILSVGYTKRTLHYLRDIQCARSCSRTTGLACVTVFTRCRKCKQLVSRYSENSQIVRCSDGILKYSAELQ